MISEEVFESKLFFLTYENILEMSNYDNGGIVNVIRGLHKQCYGLFNIENDSREINFFFISNSNNNPGILFKLNLSENYFYEYLLRFSIYTTKMYDLVDPCNVYNTFINYLRSYLEQLGYFTITTQELEEVRKMKGELFIPNLYEIVKVFRKEDFYRFLLNASEKIDIVQEANYLYLMLNKDNGFFKIGRSKNPRYREGTLQSKEPSIVLLKVWESDLRLERLVQKRFIERKVRGEWFKLDYNDILEFESIIDELKNSIR